jgi:hypothetical protein
MALTRSPGHRTRDLLWRLVSSGTDAEHGLVPAGALPARQDLAAAEDSPFPADRQINADE